MSLSIGIVGLPNVGKSTLFNALTKKQADAQNFPFCTIDPNVGIVKVPDKRLEILTNISKSKKTIPTNIEFVDIAGLVKGAHTGEGLGNKFLHNIRECDAICEIIRNFDDSNIIHVNAKIDPVSDKETINMELIMADLETVTKNNDKAQKEAKGGDKTLIKKANLFSRLKEHLDSGQSARLFNFNDEELEFAKPLHLLSLKPIIYVLNINDQENNINIEKFKNQVDGQVLELNIKQETEIAGLSDEEQTEFIKELGLKQSGLDKLITASYKLLNLITFLTTGPEETRAWTVKKGASAPEAAGVIHTDFQKGFIRAEVIEYNNFVQAGSEGAAREKGLIRTEGKDYIVQDGDVCHFLFKK
jgi:GTP-binding protein YchF